ncbi:MAG: hypothetical protein FJ144_11645 [Deltaproteobacteria bacterium]|nr:hypothetical protein [Deltaproteobacteria bacterium]
MTTLLLVAALVAAVAVMGARRWRRERLRRAAQERAGARPETAFYIRSFDEMDEHLRKRWCSCGGFLELEGEGTRELDERRYRVARMRCHECDEIGEVYFDTTDLVQ